MKKHLIQWVVLGSVLAAAVALAGEPGWESGVIKFGAERQKIQQTDVLHRPYRPLHFYGNTVRRRHYRGRAIPSVRNVSRVRAARSRLRSTELIATRHSRRDVKAAAAVQ